MSSLSRAGASAYDSRAWDIFSGAAAGDEPVISAAAPASQSIMPRRVFRVPGSCPDSSSSCPVRSGYSLVRIPTISTRLIESIPRSASRSRSRSSMSAGYPVRSLTISRSLALMSSLSRAGVEGGAGFVSRTEGLFSCSVVGSIPFCSVVRAVGGKDESTELPCSKAIMTFCWVSRNCCISFWCRRRTGCNSSLTGIGTESGAGSGLEGASLLDWFSTGFCRLNDKREKGCRVSP